MMSLQLVRHLRLLDRSGHHHRHLLSSASLSGADDSQLLHRSPVPSNFFQRSLPRLKVPKLEDSVAKYLDSQRPLLADEDFARTEKICKNFLAEEGPELQKRLLDFDKSCESGNYVNEFWFDLYLADRRPIVLNHTPFMSFNPIGSQQPDPLVRLANLLYSSAKFRLTYQRQLLKPEVYFLDPKLDEAAFYSRMRLLSRVPGHSRLAWLAAYTMKAFPLDMSQYPSLMGSTRLPQVGRDALKRDEDPRHIVVMRAGHVYRVELLGADGAIVPPEEIYASLSAVANDAAPEAEFPVGQLTSGDRDAWTGQRQRLCQLSEANRDSLETIDSALFVVCIDSMKLESTEMVCKNFLHSLDGGRNRWWDKCFSLIAGLDNGQFAVNFEHSWGDGVAVMRYFNEVFADSNGRPALSEPPPSAGAAASAVPRRLQFDLDDHLKSAIADNGRRLSERSADLSLDFHLFDEIGRADAKRAKLSPDAVAQLAIQLAYYNVSGGGMAPTYESCSTAAFRGGRTETIRSATSATKEFCRLAASAGSSAASLGEALRACSEKHGKLTKEAAMGQGWDRHLFAIRRIAERDGLGPQIFADQAYADINKIVLSTSTLSSPAVQIGGFGPVSPGGFGVGYSIAESSMGCVATAYRSEGRGAAEFVRAYGDACHTLAKVLRP